MTAPAVPSHLADPAAKAPRTERYLTKTQRDEIHQDIRSADAFLNSNQSHLRPQVPNDVRRQIINLNRMLQKGSPPELARGDLDNAVKRRDQLQERISGALLSSEEMRKNPPGAVGKFQRQEGSSRCKADILEWKNLQEIIHRDSDDPDKCNVELLRRFRTPSDLNMQDAQIEGKMFSIPSQKYMANYEQTFGPSAVHDERLVEDESGDDHRTIEELREELRRTIEEAGAKLRAFVSEEKVKAHNPEPKPGPEWTDEMRAAASKRTQEQHAKRRKAEKRAEAESSRGDVADLVKQQLGADDEEEDGGETAKE